MVNWNETVCASSFPVEIYSAVSLDTRHCKWCEGFIESVGHMEIRSAQLKDRKGRCENQLEYLMSRERDREKGEEKEKEEKKESWKKTRIPHKRRRRTRRGENIFCQATNSLLLFFSFFIFLSLSNCYPNNTVTIVTCIFLFTLREE